MATPSQLVRQIIGKQAEDALPHEMATVWFLAAIAVLLQMLTNGRYGYFRDELYFIATSKHLESQEEVRQAAMTLFGV